MKRRNVIIAAAITLILALFVLARCGKSSPSAFQTATVTRGPVTQAVTATGTLNLVVSVHVGSQVSGNIQELIADFNFHVTAGQTVAQTNPAISQSSLTHT